MVCACAVGLRGNRLTGMRGTWGVVWRSAHVPTIPFTWLRRANALGPTAHASNYQALLSIKLCEQCGSNSCVRVFFIPWGHVDNHDHIWAFVTSMGSPDLNARFWLVEKISAALWLVSPYCSQYDYSRAKTVKISVSTSGNLNRTSVKEKPRGVFYLPVGWVFPSYSMIFRLLNVRRLCVVVNSLISA